MGRTVFIPDDIIQIIIRRYESGESAQSIATQLKLAKTSVYNVLRKKGVKTARTMHSLSKEQETAIVERYVSGENVLSIAKDFPVNHQTIRNMLKQKGVPIRGTFTRVSATKRGEIVLAVQETGSVRETAKRLGVSEKTVGVSLRDAREKGATIELPQGRPRSCAVDDHAFDRNTPESMYWKGFIYSDGHVTPGKCGSPALVIGLTERDVGHLIKLRDFLKSTHAISIHPPGRQSLGGPTAYFRVRSAQLCAALTAAGIATHRPHPPAPELIESRHFWRGSIDGDGWIGMDKQFYPYIGLSGRLPVIEAYQQWLLEHFGVELAITPTKSGVYKVLASASTAERVIHALYKNAPVALERKMKRAESIISGDFVRFSAYDEGPSCVTTDISMMVE